MIDAYCEECCHFGDNYDFDETGCLYCVCDECKEMGDLLKNARDGNG